MAGYDVITFDSQTVISNGYAFHSGLLDTMKSLRVTPIRVVVTDVVKNEILKHTTHFYQQLIQKNNDSNRKSYEHGLIETLPLNANTAKDANKIAKAKFNEYLNSIGCATLDIDNISLVDVMGLFYNASAPFSKGGDKKNEFPDAISLLTLQHYATANKYRILAISGDKDWARFAADNKYFELVKDISEALDLINKHREDAYKVIEDILAHVFCGDAEEILKQMDDLLRHEIKMEFPSVNASSSWNYDYNDLYITFGSFNLIDDRFKMLKISNDLKSFKIELDSLIYYTATATFSFSALDQIDDDYFVISSDEFDVDLADEVKLLVSISIIDDEVVIEDIKITRFPRSIDFGDVEPDFS